MRFHTIGEADSGIRTRGLDHGGVALCRLSYVRNVKGDATGIRTPVSG